MKKMLLLSAGPAPAAVAPETIIISSFLELGEGKLCRAAKICGGAENVVKQGNPANIRKWIARFYCWRLYSAGSACVLLTIIA